MSSLFALPFLLSSSFSLFAFSPHAFLSPPPTRSIGEARCVREERGTVEATRLARAERERESFGSFLFSFFFFSVEGQAFLSLRRGMGKPLPHSLTPPSRFCEERGERSVGFVSIPAVMITQKNMEKEVGLEERERARRKKKKAAKKIRRITFHSSSSLFSSLFRINLILMLGRALVAALAAAILLAAAGE